MKPIILAAPAIALLVAGTAMGKGHDQSNGADGDPGSGVFAETVGPAKTLGAGKGASGGTPAADNRKDGDGDE